MQESDEHPVEVPVAIPVEIEVKILGQRVVCKGTLKSELPEGAVSSEEGAPFTIDTLTIGQAAADVICDVTEVLRGPVAQLVRVPVS